MAEFRLLVGDVRAMLETLKEESVHCVVTSPPYWGLRAYGTTPQVWGEPEGGCEHDWTEGVHRFNRHGDDGMTATLDGGTQHVHNRLGPLATATCARCGAWRGELGAESTVTLYVAHLMEVFQAVWRVLRKDGTLWLNLGDRFSSGARRTYDIDAKSRGRGGDFRPPAAAEEREKNRLGIPWRVAFALQNAGWNLRQEIIWHKVTAMPESMNDRPTTAHEYIFLLSKRSRYFYDADAVRESHSDHPVSLARRSRTDNGATERKDLHGTEMGQSGNGKREVTGTRNLRSVWPIISEAYPGPHFATFPTAIPKRAILAGTSAHGVCARCGAMWKRVVEKESRPNRNSCASKSRHYRGVSGGVSNDRRESRDLGWAPTCRCNCEEVVPATILDPFLGSGTTAQVALALGRSAVGIELNPDYAELARRRVSGVTLPLELVL